MLRVARVNALAKGLHPATGVVDIVFALHLCAGSRQQIGQGVTKRRGTAAAGVQRAGGVGAHILDLNTLPRPRVGVAEPGTGPR